MFNESLIHNIAVERSGKAFLTQNEQSRWSFSWRLLLGVRLLRLEEHAFHLQRLGGLAYEAKFVDQHRTTIGCSSSGLWRLELLLFAPEQQQAAKGVGVGATEEGLTSNFNQGCIAFETEEF